MYPTARMILVALAGVPLALVASVASPSFWLAGVAWIVFSIGLFLLDAVLAPRPSRTQVSLRMPSAICIGRAEAADVEVRFEARAPSRVELAVDANFRLRPQPHRLGFPVDAGVGQTRITLTSIRRGEGIIEAIWTRWRGPLALCWRQRRHAEHRVIPIVPNIRSVREDAVRLFQRDAAQIGLRAQLRTGEGAEFNALKEFHGGMDRRMIDWKQSARHRKLLVREFQAEENLRIVFALDTGRLMCEPLAGVPRIDRAIEALLLLSFVALRLGDRVGIFAFDERPVVSSRAVGGVNAFPMLQRIAAKLDYSTAETNFTLGLTQLSSETIHRSIIVFFTDFSDTIGAELMVENLSRLIARHVVLFVTFRDEELEAMRRAEPKQPDDVSRAVLADTMLREREAVTARLRRLGLEVIDAPVERIGTRLLETYLAIKHKHAGV